MPRMNIREHSFMALMGTHGTHGHSFMAFVRIHGIRAH
jgi:hypothetical protein